MTKTKQYYDYYHKNWAINKPKYKKKCRKEKQYEEKSNKDKRKNKEKLLPAIVT